MTFEEFLQKSPLAVLWSISERVDEMHAMLLSLAEVEDVMAITAQDILDKVTEVKDRTDAENTLLDEVHMLLIEAQATGDQTVTQRAIDQLDAIKAGAADAIVRNTPDAGAPADTGAADTGTSP